MAATTTELSPSPKPLKIRLLSDSRPEPAFLPMPIHNAVSAQCLMWLYVYVVAEPGTCPGAAQPHADQLRGRARAPDRPDAGQPTGASVYFRVAEAGGPPSGEGTAQLERATGQNPILPAS